MSRGGRGKSGFGPARKGDFRALHVLGNVHEHGTGTPGSRDTERFRDHRQQLLDGADQKIVLGGRNAHAVDVHLLKGVRPDHGAGHLPCYADNRDRVELGVGQCRQRVGRARAGCGEKHLGLARDAGHALGHEPRALLVPRQDMANHGTAGKRVVEREVGPAGNAGNGLNALSFQQTDEDFRAGHAKHVRLLGLPLDALAGGEGLRFAPMKNPLPARAGRGLWIQRFLRSRYDATASTTRTTTPRTAEIESSMVSLSRCMVVDPLLKVVAKKLCPCPGLVNTKSYFCDTCDRHVILSLDERHKGEKVGFFLDEAFPSSL